ncbi:MAG: sterol desaturase/sphingolipid hydroxylase (fatty acid hydroxylase superfamily) [Bacteriovoracaceae bacterium]|jgi:sterol desaturase/sphingolipid hydroxylase (fatty acid hydroxylase superfamily)
MISTIAFILLMTFTLVSPSKRNKMLQKSFDHWVLDLVNLPIQGILVPLLQTIFFYQLLSHLAPDWKGTLSLSPILAFSLNFIFIDYLYYWNHRLLHLDGWWQMHKVHHSIKSMDVLGTSRNTIWTTFLIVYVWANSLFIYLLEDPSFYILAASLGAALDLWKHSSFFGPDFFRDKLLLANPIDHHWHHSSSPHQNFGANLNLWDKIHGTYKKEMNAPLELGIKLNQGLLRSLIFPFRSTK